MENETENKKPQYSLFERYMMVCACLFIGGIVACFGVGVIFNSVSDAHQNVIFTFQSENSVAPDTGNTNCTRRGMSYQCAVPFGHPPLRVTRIYSCPILGTAPCQFILAH
jgi:hypothetical protein